MVLGIWIDSHGVVCDKIDSRNEKKNLNSYGNEETYKMVVGYIRRNF
jgi:hypothetical protein